MKNLTFARLAEITGAQGINLPAGEVSHIVTDSRRVTPGCLFTALVGERADGHDFAAECVKNGAGAVLCQRRMGELPQLLVPDTAAALRSIAGYWRRQFSIPVLGVTGSVGKTTAKEMLAAVLEARGPTLKTEKNFNNELGVPLTLFRLTPEHETAVVEMGISHFGEMRVLAEMVRPTIAVYTTIGDAHLEFLGDRDGVLRAKSELLEYLAPDGVVIVNGDDERLRAHAFGRRTIRCGLSAGCDVRAENPRPAADGGTDFTLCLSAWRGEAHIGAYGRHLVTAALLAAAAGEELGLTPEQILRGIQSYTPGEGRANLKKLPSLTVVDDCYNANPTSVRAGIDSLTTLPGAKRRVCVLGDMLELGPRGAELHAEIGAYAAQRTDLVLACGTLSRHMAQAAGEKGRWFATVEELLEKLPQYIRSGDAVLVKASRGMRFERVCEALAGLRWDC